MSDGEVAEIVGFDAYRVRKYLDRAIGGFIKDPPDNLYQAGFLGAVCIIYREALNNKTDDRITLCERLVGTCR